MRISAPMEPIASVRPADMVVEVFGDDLWKGALGDVDDLRGGGSNSRTSYGEKGRCGVRGSSLLLVERCDGAT